MFYCAKCRGVCPDATAKCPNCKSTKLRPVEGDDLVRLHRMDQYTASLLERRCQQEGVFCQIEPFTTGWVSYLYDNDVLPTDKLPLARWRDYDRAKDLAAQVARQVEEERAQVGQGEEVFQEMPPKKRLLVQIFSVLLFLLAIMAVVYCADAVGGWIREMIT